MEEKNTNPQQPDELLEQMPGLTVDIPEDMPQFDLDTFSADPEPQEPQPLENLFPEEPVTAPLEEPAQAPVEELPQEPPVEETPVELPEETPMEEPVEEAPMPVVIPAEEPPAPAEALPAEDFAAFDIPVDEEPAPGAVYPPEDDDAYRDPEFTPAPADVSAPIFFDPTPAQSDPEKPEEPAFGSDSLAPAFEDTPIETAFDDDQEFADMFEGNTAAAPVETKPAQPNRPVRKGRPKRKKGDGLLGIPQLLATLIWLAIIVMIGVSLGRMLWVCAADVLAFGRESKDVVVTIDKDDTIEDIAQTLYEKGLVRYPGVFELYASIAVDEGEIAPGTYTLNTILDYHALVGQMSHSSSSRAVVEDVLIPEGYNCRQIFELLEQNGICTVEELEEYAANGEFQDFWFLEGLERGDKYCLEGYLFPDTYDFYAGSTPREALGKMLLGFEARFTEELYNQLPALNERLSAMMRRNGCSQEFIDNNQLGLHELLIVASLIEEETSGASESPAIASVIYNRLTQDQEYERYLGIDAAIIYATGDAENIDTSIDNPYNTYIYAGLTPGPISNPGLSSINAALNFLDTDYYYYVLNPSTGEHQFSKTYEEHQEWIEKFREMEPTEG